MIEQSMITEAILGRIRSMVREETAETAIGPEMPLTALWPLLESIRVIELIVAIETDYDITLPDDMLGDDGELKTIADLASEVRRQAHGIADGSIRPGV